jgi:hypothetical protein
MQKRRRRWFQRNLYIMCHEYYSTISDSDSVELVEELP